MRFRQLGLLFLMSLIACSTGCSRLLTGYGESSGQSGRSSLNGFGALRQTYENAGFECRKATRLTNRVTRCDAIVWTPKLISQIDSKATGWLDRWLMSGNKTLVYIVPDSGSEREYYRDSIAFVPPTQKMSYRRKIAELTNQQMSWRLARTPVKDSGWFDVDPLPSRQPIGKLAGDWAERLEISEEDSKSIEIELTISESTEADNKATVTANVFGNTVATGPTQPNYPILLESEPSETTVTIEPLLSTALDQTIVAEITSNDWDNSRILVVAGGSLLTNYAFTKPINRQLAEQLVVAAKPAGVSDPTAVFVTSMWSKVGVSDGTPGIPKATGMEILTVWADQPGYDAWRYVGPGDRISGSADLWSAATHPG